MSKSHTKGATETAPTSYGELLVKYVGEGYPFEHARGRAQEEAFEAELEQLPETERAAARESVKRLVDFAETADERELFYARGLNIPMDRGIRKGVLNYLIGTHGMTAGQVGKLTIPELFDILEKDYRLARKADDKTASSPAQEDILRALQARDEPQAWIKGKDIHTLTGRNGSPDAGGWKGELRKLATLGVLESNTRLGYRHGKRFPSKSSSEVRTAKD